jgi:vacuolar protein sorting-associated protein 54
MTSEIASSMLSYLSLFNSRCRQLILGAGATRSAGLKNITTKHLALAAQALSFVSTIVPHLREFVRRHAGTAQVSSLMTEFGKCRQELFEHQQLIYDKLLDIMSGRATAHAKTMKTINWEKDGKDGVNAYMEALVKETNTLYKVMVKHLPEGTVKMVMQPIFKAYKEQWGAAFGDIVLRSEEAQKRLVPWLSMSYKQTNPLTECFEMRSISKPR